MLDQGKGAPPREYAVLISLLAADQDHAILFADDKERDDETHQAWFMALGYAEYIARAG